MSTNKRLVLATVLLCYAQSTSAAEPSVQPVSHSAPVALPSVLDEAAITFAQLPPRVGDRVAQNVGVELQVHTTITQVGS